METQCSWEKGLENKRNIYPWRKGRDTDQAQHYELGKTEIFIKFTPSNLGSQCPAKSELNQIKNTPSFPTSHQHANRLTLLQKDSN